MRIAVLLVLLVLAGAASSFAQPAARFEVAPVARMDRVFVEAGASGSAGVFGVAVTAMLTKTFGIDGEVTGATGEVVHSYEGWFVSAAGQGASREEIERLAPTARRRLGYRPGMGGAVAMVMRGQVSPRVRLGARIGVTGRSYRETSTYTILTVPAGIDAAFMARHFQAESHTATRGGLLLAADGVVALTDSFSIAPEVRYVYGGPARVGNKHRELGIGVRAVWGF